MSRKRRFNKRTFVANGRDCPRCGHDIGWKPSVMSMWPVSVTCPHCGEDLKYEDVRFVIITLILAAVAICVAAGFIAALTVSFQNQVGRILLTMVLIFVLWIPASALTGKYLRSHKLLVVRDATGEGDR